MPGGYLIQMPRTHTREEAIAAVDGVIKALEERAARNRSAGITRSNYENGIKYCKEARDYIGRARPGKFRSDAWGLFDRYVADEMPWEKELLKTIQDAKRIVRIYLQTPLQD